MRYKINYSKNNYYGGSSSDWTIELDKRLNALDQNALVERNTMLGIFYKKLKILFAFIQNNKIPIFMRMGGLVMTIRHNGFIDKGGLEYYHGYDNDMDVYSMITDRELLISIFTNSEYKFIESEKCRDMILREGGPENLEYYENKKYINLDLPTGYYVYEISSNTKIIDGTYLYNDGVNIIDIVNYKSTINIEKNHYKTYPEYGEYKYKKDDIFPLKTHSFYDSIVNVPNNAKDVLKTFYGNEIFSKVYSYIPTIDGGHITDKYDIKETAPPVKLIL